MIPPASPTGAENEVTANMKGFSMISNLQNLKPARERGLGYGYPLSHDRAELMS